MLFCAGNDTSAPEPSGTCVTRGLPHDGEQGESCDGIGVDTLCKPGLVCTIEQVNGEVVGRCQPQADSGGACSFAIPDACPPGEYCHIETELGVKPATGTCRAQPKLGQACRYGTIHTAPCGNGIDQLCHPDTEVCVTAKGNGEACTHDQECVATDCDDSGHCAARLECEAASL